MTLRFIGFCLQGRILCSVVSYLTTHAVPDCLRLALKVSTMSNDLKNHVQFIADSLTDGTAIDAGLDEYGDSQSAFDYLQDALDIEYIVNSKGEYLGARVLVAFGGPNIWVNTRTGTVEGAWWAARADASFKDNIGLDDALSELSACR